MLLAAIDIGTNSIHMIIVRIAADGSFEVVGREKDMVRLGAGGLEGRALTAGAMQAALQTLSRFKRLAESRGVDDIVAAATSAVREARNGGDLLRSIQDETGVRAQVITGTAEARLIHRAAVHGIDLGNAPAIVVDIGGGSTEVTLGSATGAQQARSFRLGVIRLTERFIKDDPPSAGDHRRLLRHIRGELGDYLKGLAKSGYGRVIGTSGTILSLGSLALGASPPGTGMGLHHRRVGAKALKRLRAELAGLPLERRLQLPGLDPRRADLIVAGSLLLGVILDQLGATELTLCEMSLREALVLDFIRRNRLHIERVDRFPDIRRRSVVELAQRCFVLTDHTQQVARLALELFDQTRGEHGLDERAREWLEMASLLHDTGEHISYEKHHRHSYYLIKNGDLRGFEPEEVEVIALVARYHRRAKPKKDHPGFGPLPRSLRRAVRWLSAMLRVAEALDRSRGQLVRDIQVDRDAAGWVVRLDSRADVELEIWGSQRNATALSELLGAPLRFERLRRSARVPPVQSPTQEGIQ
ncbi:MAG: Ppx/GppA phosphatase family protein [Acidobacteriota bacterium]